MQRLKDMYARNASMHERDRPPQPQGVKQLLQVEASPYLSVAAECCGLDSAMTSPVDFFSLLKRCVLPYHTV